MSEKTMNTSLVEVIKTAIQIPGVKVDRELFLREQFKGKNPEIIERIISEGPVNAQCTRAELKKLAQRIVNDRTLKSTGASFMAGLPGGLAMAATIPADILQFYGVALRMAQEVAYIYGESDLWNDGFVDDEKVTNQLIIYCGVMFGVSGASAAIRVLSSQLAKQALKKLPQMALTKTVYYPIVKSIAKVLGAKMTKEVFAKGVSKAVPVIGGVISGGLTFATMKPMGGRLIEAFDEAHFDYTQSEFEADLKIISEIDTDEKENAEENSVVVEDKTSVMDEIKKAKELLDLGVITDEEFTEIKAKLIAKL